jgi:hypothetical protein
VKKDLGSDVLIPLRKNMDMFLDSKRIAESFDYTWTRYYEHKVLDTVMYREDVTVVDEVRLWNTCDIPLYVSLMRVTESSGAIRYWGLLSTFKPKDATEAFDLYKLRTQIEERHRQLKQFWNLNEFSSPHESLIEAHVLFTLLTYSLIQVYMNKKHLNDLTNKTITTWRHEELLGKNNVIVYSGNYFGVFDLDEYTEVIAFLKEEARLRLQKWIVQFKKREKFRGG